MEALSSVIEIKEVNDYKSTKDFINLPFELYKNDDAWIPPLISDFKKYIIFWKELHNLHLLTFNVFEDSIHKFFT